MKHWMIYLTKYILPTSSSSTSRPKRRLQQVGDYLLIRTIGRGSSGQVKLAKHRDTGEYVAIKMISRRHLLSSTSVAHTVERELAILQLIHHPHLITLKQVLQDSNYVYFVTEYVDGGELYHVLAGQGRLVESEARALFIQLVTAVAWCHTHHICHRDLKPENILIDRDKKVLKVADFGMATIQPSESLLKTSCGSPHYASPEIVRGKPYLGFAVDVWSCGVILYVLLTGRFPFDDDHVPRLLAKIKSGRHRKLPDYLSSSVKNLIRRMLILDPTKRITMSEIISHPWITTSLTPLLPLLNNNVILRRYTSCDTTTVMLRQLQNPVITSPEILHGTVWETLKVLWRNMPQQNIIAALLSNEPNVQKLTFWLLQKRAERFARKKNNGTGQDNKYDHLPGTCPVNNNSPTITTTHNTDASPLLIPPSYRLPLSLYDKVQLCCDSNNFMTSSSSSSSSSSSDMDGDDDALFLCQCLCNSTTMSVTKYFYNEKQQFLIRRNLLWSNRHELTSSSLSSSSPTTTIITKNEILFHQNENDGSSRNTVEYHYSAEKNPFNVYPLFSTFINTKSNNSIPHFKSGIAEAIISQDVAFPYDTCSNDMNINKYLDDDSTMICRITLSSLYQWEQREHNDKKIPLFFRRPFGFIQDIHRLFQDQQKKTLTLKKRDFIDIKKSFFNKNNNHNYNRLRQEQQRLLSDGQKDTLSFYLTNKLYRWFFYSMVWFEEKILQEHQRQLSKSNISALPKIYTIDCAARHRGEAAGKLQQILNQNFEGCLTDGHLYPDGQIIWAGSMLANTLPSSIINFLSKEDRQLQFLCNIHILKAHSTDNNNDNESSINQYHSCSFARIRFVLIQGIPILMQSTINTLNQLLNIYEAQAQFVTEANGWASSLSPI